MAHILADRVRETATVTGTGDLTLNGAVTNFEAFSDVMSNSDTCWYVAVQSSGGWEVGVGTKASGTLQRTTVLQSSNSDSKVDFYAGGTGTVDVFMTVPASGVMTPENLGAIVAALTGKTTPVDADMLALADSAASNAPKKLTWSNLKAALKASASAFWAGSNDATFLTPKTIADASARVGLTSGTTINTDCSAGRNFKVTLGHNATFAKPTNMQDGVVYTWQINQPSSGGPYTGAFNAAFEFPSTPTLSTAASKKDLVSAMYDSDADVLVAGFRKGS